MAAEADEVQALVLDCGSAMVKAGFSGDDAPRAVFPAMVGRPKYLSVWADPGRQKSFFVGDEAQAKRGVLNLRYPVEYGVVTDWDDMTAIWQHTFDNELRVDPREHPVNFSCARLLWEQTTWPLENGWTDLRLVVLLTDCPLNPQRNRERTVQCMMETFETPAMYIANQGVLAVYASGRCTSVALCMGDGCTFAVPIYEGYTVPHAITRVDVGGRDLSAYMARLLTEAGCTLTSSSELEIVRDIKEKLGFVSLNLEADMKVAQESCKLDREYTLPDGQLVRLRDERFRCAEALFQPSLIGRESMGLPQMVLDTIGKIDIDMRRDLIGNVVLHGGTSMFVGLDDRLQNDLKVLAPQYRRSRVVAMPERKFSVWIGGSILSSLSTFQASWISQEQYQDAGPSIVHRKCFSH